MGYKCPGCKGEFVEVESFLDHFDVQKGCAEVTDEYLQKSLGSGLETMIRRQRIKSMTEKINHLPFLKNGHCLSAEQYRE